MSIDIDINMIFIYKNGPSNVLLWNMELLGTFLSRYSGWEDFIETLYKDYTQDRCPTRCSPIMKYADRSVAKLPHDWASSVKKDKVEYTRPALWSGIPAIRYTKQLWS